jgi:long-chain fatty acid transport protein
MSATFSQRRCGARPAPRFAAWHRLGLLGPSLGLSLFLSLFLALQRTAAANPADAFGIGARAPAMGSAYSAVADDAAAGYYNPAGLARSTDLRLDLGYQLARPLINVSGTGQDLMDSRGLNVGVLLPGRLFGLRFAFGLTLFLPDQQATRIRVLSFDRPRLQLYENRPQRMFLSANLAIHIYRGLYLGGGLTFMSRSKGVVYLRGRVSLSDPEQSALESAVDVNLLAIRYPQVGLLFEATRNLSFSLVYRHKFLLELEQGFNINGDVGDAGQDPLVKDAKFAEVAYSVDLFQPWQVVAGAAARFASVLVSFDLTYSRWSEQPPPAARITLDVDLGRFNELVKLAASRPYPDPGFYDTLMPAVGVEWRALKDALSGRLALDLRGGYRYEPSPVPEQDGESSFGDSDRHIFSLGLGVELARLSQILPKPLSIDVFTAFTHLPLRRFRKLDPRSLVGDFTVGGQVWQVGGQLRWRL